MNSTTPKQFLEVNSKPILMHTIDRMHESLPSSEIILALPNPELNTWEMLCKKHGYNILHTVVEGGKNRFESVKNALQKVKEKSVVAIHDGVRPLVKKSVVRQCMQSAQDKNAAIPALAIEESLRKKTDKGSVVVNRNDFIIVQTPQCFNSETILEAYQQNYNPSFTDDASVVESMGVPITIVKGNKENIKITTPEDLKLAEVYTSF